MNQDPIGDEWWYLDDVGLSLRQQAEQLRSKVAAQVEEYTITKAPPDWSSAPTVSSEDLRRAEQWVRRHLRECVDRACGICAVNR